MPIHFGPIPRRRFLARSLAAGATLTLCPKLLCADKTVDENSWALLSDTHLAANRTLAFRGVNMAEHLEKVSAELLGLPSRPAGVFINGDCAFDSGQMGDYELLINLVRPIRQGGMQVHLSLGNHDHRDHFWAALPDEKQAKRDLEDRQTALLRTSHVNWFL